MLFPAAARHLDDKDWQAIGLAQVNAADPLFPAGVEGRFEGLRRVIAQEADCGCWRAVPAQ